MLSRFHRMQERIGQTDGRTDRIATSISRVSVLMRDKTRSVIMSREHLQTALGYKEFIRQDDTSDKRSPTVTVKMTSKC